MLRPLTSYLSLGAVIYLSLGGGVNAVRAADMGMGGEIVELSPFVIEEWAEAPPPGVLSLNEEAPNLPVPMAEQLAEIPGISVNSRGSFSSEPMIRGLGFDRVVTRLNGLVLPNGSPTRTQAPVNALGSLARRHLQVSAALPSLAQGQPRTGGSIELGPQWTVRERDAIADALALSAVWVPDRDGYQWAADHSAADGAFSIQTGLHGREMGDYRSGNGRTVAASFRDWGASLVLRVDGKAGRMHVLDGLYHNQGFTENVSLPLDTISSRLYALTGTHLLRCHENTDTEFRIRYGFARSDAELSNGRREQRPILVVTQTETESGHADAGWRRRWGNDNRLTIGIEGNWEERLAVRQRGPSATDFIWPGIEYRHAGLYAESEWAHGGPFRTRAGVRWDHTRSSASDADQTAFGKPIEELYALYNDLSGNVAKNNDSELSGNLLLQYTPAKRLAFHLGLGGSAQSPPPTERYRAFLNALGGGFELGNPGLSPERKWEMILGTKLSHEKGFIRAEAWHYRVNDFIWRERVGTTEGLLPLNPPQAVFSYRNVDAAFSGLEIEGVWQVLPSIEIPFAVQWVDAELGESGPGYAKGDSLPELPPAQLRVGARWSTSLNGGLVVIEWSLQAVDSRRNPLPEVNPVYNASDSFCLHHFGLSFTPAPGSTLSLRVSNVFDTHYAPYLAPPVSGIPPASGDLRPGDPVPGPGRELVLSFTMAF